MEIRYVIIKDFDDNNRKVKMTFKEFIKFCKKKKLPIMKEEWNEFFVNCYLAREGCGHKNRNFELDLELTWYSFSRDRYDIKFHIDYCKGGLVKFNTDITYDIHKKVIYVGDVNTHNGRLAIIHINLLDKKSRKQIEALENYKKKLNKLELDMYYKESELALLNKKIRKIENKKSYDLLSSIFKHLEEEK